MKNNFKIYVLIWTIGLALFNLIAFLVPSNSQFEENYWTAYAFITIAFILQLGTAYFACKQTNAKKLFLNIPTVTISFATLIATALVSIFTATADGMPVWLGSILCFTCFAIGVVATLLAKTAADNISRIDDKIKVKTIFIKALAVHTDTLVASSQIPEIKAQVIKVHEAVRYSDPMSNEVLSSVETQITLKFNQLQEAVSQNDVSMVQTIANEMLVLINDRNNRCKLLK